MVALGMMGFQCDHDKHAQCVVLLVTEDIKGVDHGVA